MVKQFKFLVMAGLLLVVIVACQRDETLLQDEKGISLEEARQFFEKQETEKEINNIAFTVMPKWETFMQGGKNNYNAPFAFVDVIINKKFNAKLVFVKHNDSLRSLVSFSPKSKKTLVISDQKGSVQEIYFVGKDSSLHALVKSSANLQMRASYRGYCRQGNCDGSDCKKKYCHCQCHNNAYGNAPLPELNYISNTDTETGAYITNGVKIDIYLEEVVMSENRKKNDHESSYLTIYNINSPDKWFLNEFGYVPYKNGFLFDIGQMGIGGGGSGQNTKDAPDQIIDKIKDPEIKCLHSKLRNGNNDYVKEIFSKFEGNGTEFDIVISSEDKVLYEGREVNAKTTFTGSKAIHIRISESKAVGRSALDIAKTIFHEYIHADIHRKLKTINYENTPEIKSFRETYSNYIEMLAKKNNIKEVPDERRHHEYMAKYYVSVMRDALKKFHKEQLTADYNKYVEHYEKEPSDELYEALAWQGLNAAGIKAYEEEDADKKKRMNHLLETEVGMLTKNCE